jgi:hypothetical protein
LYVRVLRDPVQSLLGQTFVHAPLFAFADAKTTEK